MSSRSAVSAHEVIDAFADEVTEEISDFFAGGVFTDLVLVIGVINGADVAFFREQLFVVSGEQRLVVARDWVVDFKAAFIAADAVVGGDGIARNREAADGGAGHVDGTAGNEFFSAALKAVEGNGHGAGLLGLNREESSRGEGDCGEEGE